MEPRLGIANVTSKSRSEQLESNVPQSRTPVRGDESANSTVETVLQRREKPLAELPKNLRTLHTDPELGVATSCALGPGAGPGFDIHILPMTRDHDESCCGLWTQDGNSMLAGIEFEELPERGSRETHLQISYAPVAFHA
ncbi:ATP-dependent helicase hrpA, putative [Babesia ovata]|uniref:ATP-dependent helicase hrpA, putative n=1 Tax=Babesia ovata TaxID=189622 RepID=A0A2H6KGH4_9APIC|nr:ATP-dependent helicase hrpA, putative [Babesia ovata]GBE62069.1 ATP-dependent helicase hrpA, putative [Babesia ovata]